MFTNEVYEAIEDVASSLAKPGETIDTIEVIVEKCAEESSSFSANNGMQKEPSIKIRETHKPRLRHGSQSQSNTSKYFFHNIVI